MPKNNDQAITIDEAMHQLFETLQPYDREIIIARHPNEQFKASVIVITSLSQLEVVRILAKNEIRGLAAYVQKREI